MFSNMLWICEGWHAHVWWELTALYSCVQGSSWWIELMSVTNRYILVLGLLWAPLSVLQPCEVKQVGNGCNQQSFKPVVVLLFVVRSFHHNFSLCWSAVKSPDSSVALSQTSVIREVRQCKNMQILKSYSESENMGKEKDNLRHC